MSSPQTGQTPATHQKKNSKVWLGLGIGTLSIALVVSLLYGEVIALAMRPNPIVADEQLLVSAQKDFQQHCVSCHGLRGRGDGALASSLAEAPPDLTKIRRYTPGWTVVWITKGGDVMPAWENALSQPQILGLAALVDQMAEGVEISSAAETDMNSLSDAG